MGLKSILKGWLVVKASATQEVISMSNLGSAVWNDRDYKQFAEEGYKKNVIAYRAIGEIATSISQINWLLYRVDSQGNKIEIKDHDLLSLLLRPNERQGGSAFFESLSGFYQISGNSYIEEVNAGTGPPTELHILRPDRMKILPGKFGVDGFKYTVNGNEITWPSIDDKILHLKTFNPTDDWLGMSPMEAAAYSIDIHTAALDWNKSLLDNRAVLSGAIVYEPKEGPQTLGETSYNLLKADIEEKFSGAKNAGKPILLEGGLRWIEMGLSPSDMDYINTKHVTARDICLAYGVPPMILGIPGDNTFSNQKEARLALWEQTVLPLAYKIRDELNNWLVPKFGDDLILGIDEDSISALSIKRDQLYERLEKVSFLTINEKREEVGRSPVDGGDKLTAPANMLPIDFTGGDPISNEKKFAKWLVDECDVSEKEAKLYSKEIEW